MLILCTDVVRIHYTVLIINFHFRILKRTIQSLNILVSIYGIILLGAILLIVVNQTFICYQQYTFTRISQVNTSVPTSSFLITSLNSLCILCTAIFAIFEHQRSSVYVYLIYEAMLFYESFLIQAKILILQHFSRFQEVPIIDLDPGYRNFSKA